MVQSTVENQSYESQLLAIYSEQSKLKRNEYLEAHSHNLAVILRDTTIFRRYSDFIPARGSVLDWGCNHAPTACLVKMLRGEAVKLYGTDVHGDNFGAFYDFAGLRYTQLQHHSLLPYEDNFFDAVIGTAVLEHVPNDSASLNEIYRVLRPGGVFVVTTLPNRFSYTEWLNRRLKRPHHLRRYSLREAKYLFLHHGFLPIACGYHQVLPSMCSVGGVFNSRLLNRLVDALTLHSGLAEKIWPIRCFASNVFVVGIKVSGFDNADFDLRERLSKKSTI